MELYSFPIIDIFLTSLLIYLVYFFFKGTYTATMFKGLFIVSVVYLGARIFRLTTLTWMFERFFGNLPIILAIIFQPEIRRLFSNMGMVRHKYLFKRSFLEELAESLLHLAQTKTGALIVIEGQHQLDEILHTGVLINAVFSQSLIESIFFNGNPLHDGAVIIRREIILAASVFLPINHINAVTNKGTRHEAGVTITQDRDCISLIVSEETGSISYAKNGKIHSFSIKNLKEELLEIFS